MVYYHVRITQASVLDYDETRIDMTFDELDERFLSPYRGGSDIVINGKVIPPSDIDRIRISKSSQDSNSIREIVRNERRQSSVVAIGISEEWEIADKAEDVTDELITTPPGGRTRESDTSYQEPRPSANTREVFVVHGRNMAARDVLFDFLTAIDLHPLEWSEAVQLTGKPMPYIAQILDAAFSNAHAVVVLMTPDDEARLIDTLQSENELPYEKSLTGQARPNVLFEAGMAMGRHPERTIIVELGELRPFSDVSGLHVIRLNNSTQRRQELAQRLKAAGCPVNLDGTRWHTVGDFDRALTTSNSEEPEAAKRLEQMASTAQDSELSEDAKELLAEITRDSHGVIVKFETSGGSCYRTNGKHFGELGDPRSEARWEGAVSDLLKLDFLTVDPRGRGKLFKITREGFEAVDQFLT